MKSKTRLLKEMLYETKRLAELPYKKEDDNSLTFYGFCHLSGFVLGYINEENLRFMDILKKYKIHIKNDGSMFWFSPNDWKTRYSFLEEVCRIECNSFNKLFYKLGLINFTYIEFEPTKSRAL